jgi:peptidoglycan/xylan/chitin deacetylase (PgdA/CDA1 family)
LHDNRIATVKAMEDLIPALIQDGYTLVTVSELLAPSVPAAGAVVTRR